MVFVVGNLPELGSWNHNQAVQLTSESNENESTSVFDNNSSSDFAQYYTTSNNDEKDEAERSV